MYFLFLTQCSRTKRALARHSLFFFLAHIIFVQTSWNLSNADKNKVSHTSSAAASSSCKVGSSMIHFSWSDSCGPFPTISQHFTVQTWLCQESWCHTACPSGLCRTRSWCSTSSSTDGTLTCVWPTWRPDRPGTPKLWRTGFWQWRGWISEVPENTKSRKLERRKCLSTNPAVKN